VEPITVQVTRGGVVEAVHRVHVATTDGESYGDPELVCYLRSSSKPIQAIPFLEGYADLDDDELAITCASHHAEPAQLTAVRKVLARAGAEIDDLENGPQEGRPDGKLGNNCSGKHAGMLAACRAHGWPLHPYCDAGHPLQEQIAQLIGPHSLVGVDGCGVPTFAVTLSQAAALLTRTPQRIRRAMQAKPELVGASSGAVDTELMRRGGWIAKGGAEGLFCAAADDGRGIALKAEDGGYRAIGPALGRLLDLDAFRETPITDTRGELVGVIRLGG
jgi:L-asparaginase II